MTFHIRGTVLPDGSMRDVFLREDRITFEPQADAETLLEDVVLIPGLVDAHAHLSLASPAPPGASPVERARASALAQLDAGVLAIREPGSPDGGALALDSVEGLPRIWTAGRFLAPPGRYFPGLALEVTDDELPDAAEAQARASGWWTKVIGDSPLGGFERTYGAEALVEAARRVHALGARIAIHCGLPEVIQDAIDAGFDSIEHGTFLAPDQVAPLARSGAAWTPTLLINEAIGELLADDRPSAEIDALFARQSDVLQAATDGGVMLLAGTDAGMGAHGRIRHEIERIASAGVAPQVALGAGSWTARSWLGMPGIEEGAPADLVAFRADPRLDLAELGRPVLVMLRGRVVRSSG